MVAKRWKALAVTIAVTCLPTAFGKGSSFAQQKWYAELTPPRLPCPIRSMTAYGDQIFVLGQCGTVVRWDPFNGASETLNLEGPVGEAFAIAATKGRLAILTDQRRTIRVFETDGKLLRQYHYTGDSYFTSIALTPDAVAASSFFDAHLLTLFLPGSDVPVRLVDNPRYWPDASPRFSSFVGVHAYHGKFFVFDLIDFTLHIVDPTDLGVTTSAKQPHPWQVPCSKPNKAWAGNGDHYTGTMLAVSSTVANDCLYVLMLDRTLSRGNYKPGDGFLEVAVSCHSEKGWKTVARLKDPQLFGGSEWLSIIDNTALLLKPGGVVYGLPLSGR